MIHKLTNYCVSRNWSSQFTSLISSPKLFYLSSYIVVTNVSIVSRLQTSSYSFLSKRLFLSLSLVNLWKSSLERKSRAVQKRPNGTIKQIRRKLNSTPSHASHLENLSLSEFIRNREESLRKISSHLSRWHNLKNLIEKFVARAFNAQRTEKRGAKSKWTKVKRLHSCLYLTGLPIKVAIIIYVCNDKI